MMYDHGWTPNMPHNVRNDWFHIPKHLLVAVLLIIAALAIAAMGGCATVTRTSTTTNGVTTTEEKRVTLLEPLTVVPAPYYGPVVSPYYYAPPVSVVIWPRYWWGCHSRHCR